MRRYYQTGQLGSHGRGVGENIDAGRRPSNKTGNWVILLRRWAEKKRVLWGKNQRIRRTGCLASLSWWERAEMYGDQCAGWIWHVQIVCKRGWGKYQRYWVCIWQWMPFLIPPVLIRQSKKLLHSFPQEESQQFWKMSKTGLGIKLLN